MASMENIEGRGSLRRGLRQEKLSDCNFFKGWLRGFEPVGSIVEMKWFEQRFFEFQSELTNRLSPFRRDNLYLFVYNFNIIDFF